MDVSTPYCFCHNGWDSVVKEIRHEERETSRGESSQEDCTVGHDERGRLSVKKTVTGGEKRRVVNRLSLHYVFPLSFYN